MIKALQNTTEIIKNVQNQDLQQQDLIKTLKLDEDTDETDRDIKIQSNRLLYVLDKIINKLKLLAYLPQITANDGACLRKYMTTVSEIDFIMNVYAKYRYHQHHQPQTKFVESSHHHHRTSDGNTKQKLPTIDVQMAHLIEIVTNSSQIDRLITSNKCAVRRIDPSIGTFIDLMGKLVKITNEKLMASDSANDEKRRDDELKLAYRIRSSLELGIKDLEVQLKQLKEQLGKEQADKEIKVQILNAKIKNAEAEFKDKVQNFIHQSEKTMTANSASSELRQKDMALDAKQATEHYQSLLDEHLANEKIVRAKRLKVETQLASWLAKYDQDIGERQTEMEALQKDFDDEKAEFDELQEKFDEQEEQYVTLMEEKEEEERVIFEERAYQFLMARSARLIQRYWRAYRARKLARKKSRKGKKKNSADRKSSGRKSPGKDKPKKKEVKVQIRGGPDPNAFLEGKFNQEIMGDLASGAEAFVKKDVVVDLAAD